MRVIVIGAGISGLAAAHRLLDRGARVTVLEADSRVGGKLRVGEIAGQPVDLGAEAMLARRPEGSRLAEAVGLGPDLCAPRAVGSALWSRGALRPLPRGQVMGVPDDPAQVAEVISPEGRRRIAAEVGLPALELGRPGGPDDVAIGELVAERLGPEVVDRLVEPLLGGVYAGDPYRISLRAAVPALFEAARHESSLADAVRRVRGAAVGVAGGPVFHGVRGGVGRLPQEVARSCRERGAELRHGAEVREVLRVGQEWRVALGGGEALSADAVVLAVPAPVAGRLLAGRLPRVAGELEAVEYAPMALVTLAFRRTEVAGLPEVSGFLVPPVEGRGIKAATFSGTKWEWVGEGDEELYLLRTSLGRLGDARPLSWEDEELVRVSLRDLEAAVGLRARPVRSLVTRWPGGLPQYPVGHLDRVAAVRREVAALPGLALCGAAYDGVGIPACVASGESAADAVLPSEGQG